LRECIFNGFVNNGDRFLEAERNYNDINVLRFDSILDGLIVSFKTLQEKEEQEA
jgi:hypothetical protein